MLGVSLRQHWNVEGFGFRRRQPGSARTWLTPAGAWQGRSSWSHNRDEAIRFLSHEEAEACCHATPADAPLRPDGTPDRPLSVYRVALEYEPPRLPPATDNPGHQSLLRRRPGRGYLTLATNGAPPRRRGTVPSRQAGRSSRAPACSAATSKASYIDIRPGHRPDVPARRRHARRHRRELALCP